MLKKVKEIIAFISCTAAACVLCRKIILRKTDKEYLEEHDRVNKFRSYFNTLLLWQKVSLEGKKLSDYLNDSESVVVYGMGDIGKLICRALKNDGKNLKYAIDKSTTAVDPSLGIKTYLLDEELPQADVAIISLEYISDQITETLKGRGIGKIVTIDEVLEALLGEAS